MKFVSAGGNQVSVELAEIFKRLFAKPLNRVGMKNNFTVAANCTKLGNRLDGSNFIIRRHDGNESGVRADRLFQIVWRNAAFCIDREARDFKTFFFFQVVERPQNRIVLDGGSDQMFAFCLEQARRSKNREIIRLRSAAGENNLAGFRAQKFCRAVTRIVEQSARFSSDVVDGRRVAPKLAEKRQHCFAHRRIEWRCGIVIEVNCAWHRLIFEEMPRADETKSSPRPSFWVN